MRKQSKECPPPSSADLYGAPPMGALLGDYSMWQSNVEIEGYSIAHFDHIAAFEVLYHGTSVKGRAQKCFVDLLDLHA